MIKEIVFPSKKGLGLVDNSNRKVKSGIKYDPLFPKALGMEQTVIHNTTINQTVLQMMTLIQNTLAHTKKIAQKLRRENLDQTLRAVFNFTLEHIKYKLDKNGTEQLRTPARSWADRHKGIDCDCFSIFIGSILKNLNIPFSLRIADYGNGYQHVYVVVKYHGKQTILDPVILHYNYQKTPQDYKDYEVS